MPTAAYRQCASKQNERQLGPMSFYLGPKYLRVLVLVVCAAVFGNGVAYAAKPDTPPITAEGVHQKLTMRGIGKGVKVIRKDGSEIKGSIVTIGQESADIKPQKKGPVTTVAYVDVADVKGPGLSTGAKIGIGVGIGVVVAAGVVAIVLDQQLKKL